MGGYPVRPQRWPRDRHHRHECKPYATGIAKALGLKEKPKPKQTGKLYKVQVGAFSKRENAEKLLKELKAKGFDGFIKIE